MNTTKSLLIRLSMMHCRCQRNYSRLKLYRKRNDGFSSESNSSPTHARQSYALMPIISFSGSMNCRHRTLPFSSVAAGYGKDGRRAWCESSDIDTENLIAKDFKLIRNFISDEEEKCLLKEAESYLKRIRYEYDHWDNAIHGYRETEKSRWNDNNKAILQRVRDAAFEPGVTQLTLVHVLDLAKDGYIKPHVDSVKFCGSTITGLSLLSASVMRLANEENPKQWVNVLLEPRSLYIMKGQSRYNFTHEILKQEESVYQGKEITRDRRISIMCRNEPTSRSSS